MEKRIGLLFDCLRAPYDTAHIMQVATALGICDLYTSGNSINTNHIKVVSKVRSWGITQIPDFEHFTTFENAIEELHRRNKYLVGTSPHARDDIYTANFTSRDTVIVFGTESSGLTERKASLLDKVVRIPMVEQCKFLTLPTAVPVIAYEFYRQLRSQENGRMPKR
jgi:tRNA (cytidine/uridine-2'-O-)-methyltransferase